MHLASPNGQGLTPPAPGIEAPKFGDYPVGPNPISIHYRIALLAVAAGVFALPAIYLGIIAMVACALYFHLTRDYSWFFGNGPGSGFPALVAYVGLGIVGLTLIVFLVRPLFTRKAPPPGHHEITSSSDPAFFDLIAGICRRIKAPQPSRIFVDWTANASASLGPGFRAVFRKDLELMLGLPLVSHLTIAQCGGVIAHELGHFSQGLAMRLGSLINRSNDWFSRVAFQPEAIEQRLAQTVQSIGLYGRVIYLAARVSLWITRRILHVLMLLGHMMSCYSLRQMEFDADLCAVKIAGKENLSSVARLLRYLSDTFDRSIILLHRGLARQRCPRDFVALVEARAQVTKQYEGWHPAFPNTSRTHWFDTHPSDSERIARIELFQGSPVLIDPRPAKILFSDFVTLSRSVTEDFYRHVGLPTQNLAVMDVDEFCAGEALTPTQGRDVNRFFSNRTVPERPIALSPDSIRTVNYDANASLAWIEQWHQDLGETEKAFDDFLAYRRERFDLLRDRTLLQARAVAGWNPLSTRSRSLEEIDVQLQKAGHAMARADLAIEQFDRTAINRLTHALRLLADSERDQAIRVAEELARLGGIWPLISELQEKLFCLGQTFMIRSSNRPRSKAARLRMELALELSQTLQNLEEKLGIEDPLEPDETIAMVVARRLPTEKLSLEQDSLVRAREHLSYVQIVYFYLLAQLCTRAAAAEKSIRTTPVPVA